MLAVGTDDGRVRLIDVSTGNVRWEVQSHQEGIFCHAAMAPDGRVVASVGNSEESWKLLDPASGVVCMTGARHD